MADIKRKSQFNEKRLTPEQLEEGILRNPDGSVSDELEIAHGNPQDLTKFAQHAVGPLSRGALLEHLEQDESVFHTDSKALERESTAPVVASPVIMSDELESKVVGAGMLQATLETPAAMNAAKISPLDRKELAKALLDARNQLPTPDATTYIDHRRVVLPAEVRDTPNQLTKAASMKILEIIIGQHMALKVAKCARQNGFNAKPLLWLAQRVAAECKKRQLWKQLDKAGTYNEQEDGNKDSEICQAVERLFSSFVFDELYQLCELKRISMRQCVMVMVDRVCDQAIQERAPKDYVEKYDNLDSLEIMLGKIG